MNLINAYHITNVSNIKSILENGLVPDIGENSRKVQEQHFFTYFTTSNFIETWIDRFQLDKNELVILKFPCKNYNQRYDSANDYFTFETISPANILVVTNEEIPLKDYYQQNKEKIDVKLTQNIIVNISTIIERLEQIKSVTLDPEDGWDYNEAEPNLIKTMDLLKQIRSLNDKKDFFDIITYIKEETLKKLVNNDLGITDDSKIYKALDMFFCDSISNTPKIDVINLNYATTILSINLFYRQLDRYKRTSKKYGDDNTIWQLDRFPIDEIISKFNVNPHLKELLEETTSLYERQRTSIYR